MIKQYCLLFVLALFFCSCSKDNADSNPDTGKYLKSFIGTWSYDGYQVNPYGKNNVNTPSTLTIYSDGKFTFKGESMFQPYEKDFENNLVARIIDDQGTWSFDENKGILTLIKSISEKDGTSRIWHFYFKVTYPDNGMLLHGYSSQTDWVWYFVKRN